MHKGLKKVARQAQVLKALQVDEGGSSHSGFGGQHIYAPNLDAEEHRCMQDMKSWNDVVIKPSDKGGNVVLCPCEQYIGEAMRPLSDPECYKRLLGDPTNEFLKHYNEIISDALLSGVISKREYDFMELKLPIEEYPTPEPYYPVGLLDLEKELRKSNLFAELRAHRVAYTADLEKAARILEDKKNDLETRINFASGLKKAPSLSTYCDLNQLVADLKVNLDKDCVVPETLKMGAETRVFIQTDKIIHTFEKVGKIYSAKDANSPQRLNGNHVKPSKKGLCEQDGNGNKTTKPWGKQCESECVIEQEMQQECRLEFKPITCSESTHCGPREFVSPFAALHQSQCSPDVIIEEIIEDDHSSTSNDLMHGINDDSQNMEREPQAKRVAYSEISADKQKYKKFDQKRSTQGSPFGQKSNFQELVFLSHVINPCNFYIQRYSQKKPMIMLENKLKIFGIKSNPCCPSDILVLGEAIVVNSTEQQIWCRGTITELVPLESKYVGKPCGPTKYKIEDIARLKVFLFDYGNSEFFITSRFADPYFVNPEHRTIHYTLVKDLCHILRKISSTLEEQLKPMRPFAVHCSLMDIVPCSSFKDGLWSKEAKEEFVRMINNKGVLMKVYKEEDNLLFVDLRKPLTCKINNDMPISLREALVFMELAREPTKNDIDNFLDQFKLPKISDPELEELYKPITVKEVIEELKRFRSHVPATEEKSIIIPLYNQQILPKHMTEIAGMVSHVNDPSDFYIHVFDDLEYVNLMEVIQNVYNNEEKNNMEILYPVVGQACIAKFEDEQWYRGQVIGLPGRQEVQIKYVDFGNISRVNARSLRKIKAEFLSLPPKAICCRLAYIEPNNNTGQWSVEACEIFEAITSDRQVKCIAIGILLDNKLSVELFDDHKTSINTMLVEEEVASLIPCTPGRSVSQLSVNEVWDPTTDLTSVCSEYSMDITSLCNSKDLSVRISNCVSPSKIYVQWLSTEPLLKSLQAKMSENFKNSPSETVSWQVEMYVAVQVPIIKQWRRAQIKSIISETLVEVLYYDFGIEEIIDVMNIRVLNESLKAFGKLCLECCLNDIRPAGGSTNWTATACDVLSYYLKGAIATIVIEENSAQWPLPVRLSRTDEAGQQVDISEFLVRKGLALKERRLSTSESVMEINENPAPINKENGFSTNEDHQQNNSVKSVVTESNNNAITEPVTVEPITEQNCEEPYLPPVIPDDVFFAAKVTCIGEDGIIYVIHCEQENELSILMVDIQTSFKGLGLLAPYRWKKGEGCLVKGSDTMSYRGKVLEILGGSMIRVQYVDYGHIEKIPTCHLYPFVFNSDIPQFCIPCQLHNTLPIGDTWQADTIELLEELLKDRNVDIHVVEPPKSPGCLASVYMYCANASVSAILEQHAHCVPEDCEKKNKVERSYDLNNSLAKKYISENHVTKSSLEKIFDNSFNDLLLPELETPLLPRYSLPKLPHPGELFAVTVRHIQTPSEVFVCLDSSDGTALNMDSSDGTALNMDTNDSGLSSDFDEDTLASNLKSINLIAQTLPSLTDFRSEMPCLAEYADGQLHRAKLLSIMDYDPPRFVVEFVDYGSTAVLETSRLFQLPPSLIEHPAKAIKVKLAGFKPPKEDFETERLPYCPAWSLKALWAMMDLLQGKELYASCITSLPDLNVFLYDEKQNLVHKSLITMGLAELEK
ncbi:RING finger protein 17 [Discoglossus pictus]